MSSRLDVPTFVARWQRSTLTERSAAQQHFIDLCAVLGEPTPAATDPDGTHYTFEKGARKTSGAGGWADVWMRRHFAWEYKGKHKDLKAAYRQIQQYREDLENPPLLIVCDLDRFEVHTNFTNTVKAVYAFDLDDLARNEPTPTCSRPPLEVLRAVFTSPDLLRPNRTTASVTEDAAREFAALAESLRRRGEDPEAIAHFLMRLLFCLFAEDIDLLPAGLFTRLVAASSAAPGDFGLRLRELFARMATGGFFGEHKIPYFNGGLFADDTALPLTAGDVAILARAAALDWASIEPAIFGTLFERSLDPTKRSQLGAHYTSRDDILLIVEPVLMAPLRRRWATVQEEARVLIAKRDAATGGTRTRQQQALERLLLAFVDEIAAVRVLDPACGSGNFLYVALKRLLDLWHEVNLFAANNGVSGLLPYAIRPAQLYGIELNVYAHELASIVVWIGYIQWRHENGYVASDPDRPVLEPLHNIRHMDAVLAYDEAGHPVEPLWPEADVIIGNPPFLGGKRLRAELGDAYVDALFALYGGRVPREGDLVCYFFARAQELVTADKVRRVGLLATNSIRGGANRRVLERIKQSGDIFMAWSDRPWVLDGAAVRVSMVGFDDGAEGERVLNGLPVPTINADLTGTLDLTTAQPLPENRGIAFMGDTKGGTFDLASAQAAAMLAAPANPHGRPNSDVVRPWVNSLDVTRRPRSLWIVDFGISMPEDQAALYEQPYEYVKRHVQPARVVSRTTRPEWWLHERPRPDLRAALAPLPRYVATPSVSKHRVFVWMDHPTLPDHQLLVFARADDYFFGVLHSHPHEVWALSKGTSLEDRPRYTPTTTFETFPFPWTHGQEPTGDPRVETIAAVARELVALRDGWLDPPDASEVALQKRTLTELYNKPPTWLVNAHRRLDRAVLDAYGWPYDLGDEEILGRLLTLNLERAGVLNPAMVPGLVNS